MANVIDLLGDEASFLLDHTCNTISRENIHAPGPDYIDQVVAHKNRKPAVLRNLNATT